MVILLGEMIDRETAALENFEFNFFEPITRARSNTWPLPKYEDFIEDSPSGNLIHATDSYQESTQSRLPVIHEKSDFTLKSSFKRKSSVRYAFGDFSYADLITQAISEAKDRRLTLSEIYNWMIDHVSSIKDKEKDPKWKNRIRHNLSLQHRFIRVPNEVAGRSSWWMLNPNENFEKVTSRQRSASITEKKYGRSRSRAKKNAQCISSKISKIEAIADQYEIPHTLRANNIDVKSTLISVATQTEPIPNTCTIHYTAGETLSPISNEAEYKPELYQMTTRFNSFLDDVNDIISKEMTDCKIEINEKAF